MGLLGAIAKRSVDDWVKLGYPESVAKRIVSGELPMDDASRMARAKDMGFDVDNVFYHGTNADFNEFKPSAGYRENVFGAQDSVQSPSIFVTDDKSTARFFAENRAENLGGNPTVKDLYIKKGNSANLTGREPELTTPESLRQIYMSQYNKSPSEDYLFDKAAEINQDDYYEYISNIINGDPLEMRVAENLGTTERPSYYYDNEALYLMMDDPAFTDRLIDSGYDSAVLSEGSLGDSVALLNPRQLRSTDAAFDPEYTGSNLLGMRPEALSGLMAAIGSSEQPENLYGTDQATPPTQRQIVNQQMNALGIDPVEQAGYEYGSLIPIRKNKQTGEIEPAVPAVGRDIIRGLLDLMEGTQSGYFDPRSAIDVMM